MKKKQEESALEKLSSWYQDGELENKQDGGDKAGSRGHGRADEGERRKMASKFADHEGSQRSKSKEEKSRDGELEKVMERDSRHSDRKETNREKGHGSSDQVRNPRRRWDDADSVVKGEESNYEKADLRKDNKASPLAREDRSGREKNEKHRQQRTPTGRDVAENRERSFNTDEDGSVWMRDKSGREVGHSNRSRTPERSGRRHQGSENYETDYERSDSWGDRNRDREGSKESWKRRQPSSNDKETKEGDVVYDHGRDWELPRHARDRTDGRSGNRKDGSRGEAVKTSSNFGIASENYDVIEIQTKPLDYGRADMGSNFGRRTEGGPTSDMKSAPNAEEWAYMREDRARRTDDIDIQGGKGRGQKGAMSGRAAGGQSSSSGNRVGRGGRGRPTGRDNQQVGIPLPLMGSPFGPLGMPPPGPMQQLNPSMSPAPGPPISPGVFIPPFSPPVVWPGARAVDMNMLAVPPGLSSVPPGPSGPRFSPNIGTPPSPAMYFNQPGPGRGLPPSISGPGFNASGSVGRGQSHDKAPGGWVPPRSGGPPGKAPSRGDQNDYSQNFVDTGMRPQNFIRELELTNVVEDYPKLRELIQKKDEIVAKSASPPMYYKCDLREHALSPEFFGTKFDVILVDPPWEEYVHRAPGVADHMEYWTFEEILNLKIEAIADTPSFIFLWVGDGVGLEQGRQCLKKWGFRRCEDICWVKTNKTNATPGLRHDSHTLFQHSKEHCLMGIKGTVRRSTDGHIIHANIDTDVIIAEEPPYGSTAKPEDMYRIIEHFSLGRRRLELFGEDHNIRSGWLTVGNGLSSSNFNAEAYVRNFGDKDGKVWQGGGGRNPPPEAPHLVMTTPEIESLRPKSPMKNQQQLQQQQSTSISLTTANSSNKRPAGNSPQNPNALSMNQEASSSNPSTPAPWASPMDAFKGRETGNMSSEDKGVDIYGYNTSFGQINGDYLDFEVVQTKLEAARYDSVDASMYRVVSRFPQTQTHHGQREAVHGN
ncbi:unnamed protein product, partial [Vitis vinifera]